jgi:hypothetical protein
VYRIGIPKRELRSAPAANKVCHNGETVSSAVLRAAAQKSHVTDTRGTMVHKSALLLRKNAAARELLPTGAPPLLLNSLG